jgi:hypothetical protein
MQAACPHCGAVLEFPIETGTHPVLCGVCQRMFPLSAPERVAVERAVAQHDVSPIPEQIVQAPIVPASLAPQKHVERLDPLAHYLGSAATGVNVCLLALLVGGLLLAIVSSKPAPHGSLVGLMASFALIVGVVGTPLACLGFSSWISRHALASSILACAGSLAFPAIVYSLLQILHWRDLFPISLVIILVLAYSYAGIVSVLCIVSSLLLRRGGAPQRVP